MKKSQGKGRPSTGKSKEGKRETSTKEERRKKEESQKEIKAFLDLHLGCVKLQVKRCFLILFHCAFGYFYSSQVMN